MLLPFIGCAGHGPVHVAPDESRPHLTWEIRAGGRDGDAELICGSSQRAKPCVLSASTEQTPSLATVRLRVHAAAQPTSYLGLMRVSLFGTDANRRLGEVNTTLKPGSRPVGTTVFGRVTTQPGTHTLTISVDATQPGAPNPVHLSEEVLVMVHPSSFLLHGYPLLQPVH
jgi:hypothetical protein